MYVTGAAVVATGEGAAVGRPELGVDVVGSAVVAACVVPQRDRRVRRLFTKKQRCELPPEPPVGPLLALTKMAQ